MMGTTVVTLQSHPKSYPLFLSCSLLLLFPVTRIQDAFIPNVQNRRACLLCLAACKSCSLFVVLLLIMPEGLLSSGRDCKSEIYEIIACLCCHVCVTCVLITVCGYGSVSHDVNLVASLVTVSWTFSWRRVVGGEAFFTHW